MDDLEQRRNEWVAEIWISLFSYLLPGIIVSLFGFSSLLFSNFWLVACLGTVVIVVPLVFKYASNVKSAEFVSILALFLGLCSTSGVLITTRNLDNPLCYFGLYVLALSFFHQSEYLTTALFNPHRLSLDSYILNHSTEYHIAAVTSWAEFTLEYWLFPSLKSFVWIARIGLVLVASGELMRKLAMFTARSNFSHLVMQRKAEGHELVTHGVYGWSRHPAYVGWFYWSIGTQMLLCNPLCTVAYAAASWRFFHERIEDEEAALLRFFGRKYMDYQARVGTGLPFIRGFIIKTE